MSISTGPWHLAIAVLAAALSLPAAAWTPYGSGPYPGGFDYDAQPGAVAPPGSGGAADAPAAAPGGPFYGPPFPGGPPPAPGFPGFGPPPGAGEGFPGAGGPGFGGAPGMRISRDASADAYGLTIELDGIDAAAVQVSAVGQSLVISRERSEQQIQEDSFDDGRGFVRSFSYSSGSASRRVSVPPDGDLSAMRREDGDGRIRITIPRQGRSGTD